MICGKFREEMWHWNFPVVLSIPSLEQAPSLPGTGKGKSFVIRDWWGLNQKFLGQQSTAAKCSHLATPNTHTTLHRASVMYLGPQEDISSCSNQLPGYLQVALFSCREE